MRTELKRHKIENRLSTTEILLKFKKFHNRAQYKPQTLDLCTYVNYVFKNLNSIQKLYLQLIGSRMYTSRSRKSKGDVSIEIDRGSDGSWSVNHSMFTSQYDFPWGSSSHLHFFFSLFPFSVSREIQILHLFIQRSDSRESEGDCRWLRMAAVLMEFCTLFVDYGGEFNPFCCFWPSLTNHRYR